MTNTTTKGKKQVRHSPKSRNKKNILCRKESKCDVFSKKKEHKINREEELEEYRGHQT